ncbi:MAG: DNA polymerase III subunit delta' [Gammaproteobacteria bacterium]|nr:DNA polymerase III subunit delta' [Gammaproteobacteria bacterium]MCP5424290.1 DNA polymerase III subunit delta' [Gammaproteobacteria bacterium]MCP5459043.1 DNA polymerase III subunit delta' [Gammaproteobacteria bacterium]
MTEILPWQRGPWQGVQKRRAAGRLPHALLCSGVAGLGKLRFANTLAQSLLCSTPDGAGGPCGTCCGCRLFLAGTHPDFKRAEPDEPGKPIKVDSIRELCEFLAYTSQYNGYKIAVVAPADQMNANAANSLLKTLEEPSPNSLLLLVTAYPSRLLATVRSRCQTIAFHAPPRSEAVSWLVSQRAGQGNPELLLSLSDGAPLKALAYAEGGRLANRLTLLDNYQQLLNGHLDPILAAESWAKGDVAEQIQWLIGWHMDMIRLKIIVDPPRLLNPDLRSKLQTIAARHSVRTLYRRLDAAMRLSALSNTPINTQWMLETFLAGCASGS